MDREETARLLVTDHLLRSFVSRFSVFEYLLRHRGLRICDYMGVELRLGYQTAGWTQERRVGR
jgi:hypothetical protein